MIKVIQITDLNDLLKYWPKLLALVKKESPQVVAEHFLQLLLTCYDNGAVFVVRNFGQFCGMCCVQAQPDYTLVLRGIPNDKGTGAAKACIEAVKSWGQEHEYETLEVSSERLNGSAFRYFEKSLGFRRKFVTFVLPINK